MIDFACKQFDLDDIIKCGLGLTKKEVEIMKYFLKNKNKECTTFSISKKLDLNLTTIQKAVKKLSEKNIIIRHQKNLSNGGYVYTYEINSKQKIRKILKNIIKNWADKVEEEIDKL
ncbi:MAG: helix-turn-helix domain-containing protein [Nanoarchaeota archaeon]